MCEYGEKSEFALVLSDPHWYAETSISKPLKRDILAAMDPDTWGNVWPARELPYDMSCCCCPLPDCPGNCQPQPGVGWDYVEPTPEPEPVITPPPPPPPPPAGDYSYFPEPEEEEEPVVVPGKG